MILLIRKSLSKREESDGVTEQIMTVNAVAVFRVGNVHGISVLLRNVHPFLRISRIEALITKYLKSE